MEDYSGERRISRWISPSVHLSPSTPALSSLLFRYLSRSPSRGVSRSAIPRGNSFSLYIRKWNIGRSFVPRSLSMLRSSFRFIRLSRCSTANISPTGFSSAPDIRRPIAERSAFSLYIPRNFGFRRFGFRYDPRFSSHARLIRDLIKLTFPPRRIAWKVTIPAFPGVT